VGGLVSAGQGSRAAVSVAVAVTISISVAIAVSVTRRSTGIEAGMEAGGAEAGGAEPAGAEAGPLGMPAPLVAAQLAGQLVT
jgi:hypothetical protein